MRYDDIFLTSEALPKPLSSEESLEYLKKIKNGDIEAREKFLTFNLRLVLFEVLKEFKNVYNVEKSDLFSIGCLGLIKAVDSFDLSKDNSFSSYAKVCIDNEILNYLKKQRTGYTFYSLDDFLYNDEGRNDKKLESVISDSFNIEEDYESKEVNGIVGDLLDELTPREKKMVMLNFGFYDDKIYSKIQIAGYYRLSRQRVSTIIKNAVMKLRTKLQEREVITLRYQKKV